MIEREKAGSEIKILIFLRVSIGKLLEFETMALQQ